MWQTALTFWFTIVTLIGPGVCCCCSVATAKPAETAQPSKPAKSCCEQPIAPRQSPAEPAKKCPCERVKHETTATTDDMTGTSGIATGSNWVLPDPSIAVGSGSPARHPVATVNTSQLIPPPSGRTLLALYSTLRC